METFALMSNLEVGAACALPNPTSTAVNIVTKPRSPTVLLAAVMEMLAAISGADEVGQGKTTLAQCFDAPRTAESKVAVKQIGSDGDKSPTLQDHFKARRDRLNEVQVSQWMSLLADLQHYGLPTAAIQSPTALLLYPSLLVKLTASVTALILAEQKRKSGLYPKAAPFLPLSTKETPGPYSQAVDPLVPTLAPKYSIHVGSDVYIGLIRESRPVPGFYVHTSDIKTDSGNGLLRDGKKWMTLRVIRKLCEVGPDNFAADGENVRLSSPIGPILGMEMSGPPTDPPMMSFPTTTAAMIPSGRTSQSGGFSRPAGASRPLGHVYSSSHPIAQPTDEDLSDDERPRPFGHDRSNTTEALVFHPEERRVKSVPGIPTDQSVIIENQFFRTINGGLLGGCLICRKGGFAFGGMVWVKELLIVPLK